jgi:hypothetical protein
VSIQSTSTWKSILCIHLHVLQIILVGHDKAESTALYITDDGGRSFHFYTAPFLLIDAFVWHPKKEDWLLARAANSAVSMMSMTTEVSLHCDIVALIDFMGYPIVQGR